MANTGLLVLSNPAKVRKLLPVIGEHVLKTLYIQYFPEKNGLLPGNYSLSSSKWKSPSYAKTVANIYAIASTFTTLRLDVRVLLNGMKNSSAAVINTKRPVELVIFDRTYSKNDACTFMQDCLANTSMGCQFMIIDNEKAETEKQREESTFEAPTETEPETRVYGNVILGGTFDRLHSGHKILLSEALLRCSKKLTIGVTDLNMLSGKILWELIEPCAKRIEGIRDFLEDVDSSIAYEIVPIKDMYGPTRWDKSMEMIVVSEETIKGAKKINEFRLENGLNKLEIHVVKLVQDPSHRDHEESKISSSNQRIRLLGTRLKESPGRFKNPPKPYIIGLTGGIASGKSSVAQKLRSLGAGLVNCDKIAHDLYEPGKRCFELVVENFGRKILKEDGTIDRKALGKIVFGDKKQLDKLNHAVWPAIFEEARKQIEQLHRNGFDVIVMEAAVLIQAKWQNVCHEIWTCIIPHEEAVKRVIERNSMTEEEAESRIQAQPSNVEQVAEATVVVSTIWSHEVTLQQVQRAWNDLKKLLENNGKS